MAIWAGLETHERPYPGDLGIRFESVPGATVTRPQPPDQTTVEMLREDGLLPAQEPAKEPAPARAG